jgi:hypothetical protein
LYVIFMYGFTNGVYIAALMWSFFILCVPGSSSGFILTPFWMLTGYYPAYGELFIWSIALTFNIYTLHQTPHVYGISTNTHLLYWILTHPWPYWIIIATCTLGTLYRTFIGRHLVKKRRFLHYLLNSILFTLGFFVLIYLSYHQFALILNIRADL